MQGARPDTLGQCDGQVVGVALGLAEDDGAAPGAVALDEVGHHGVTLAPVGWDHEVLHARGRLHRGPHRVRPSGEVFPHHGNYTRGDGAATSGEVGVTLWRTYLR